MKKLIFFGAIAVLAVACQTNEVNNSTRKAIDFRTISGTRANVDINSQNITSFALFGEWVESGALKTTDQFSFAYNQTVTRDNGAATWHYTPKLYWPEDDGTVNFYAYSPAGSVNATNFLKTDATPVLAYVAPDLTVANTNEDFLVAAKFEQNATTPGVAPVTLKFYHALSQISFVAKNVMEDVTFIVEEIRLVNLVNNGTLDLSVVNDPNNVAYNTAYGDFQPLPAAWTVPAFVNDADGSNYHPLLNENTFVAPLLVNHNASAADDVWTKLGQTLQVIPQVVNVNDAPVSYGFTDVPADHLDMQYIAIKFRAVKSGSGEPMISSHWTFFPYNLIPYNTALVPSITDNRFVMGVSYTFQLTFNDKLGSLTPISFSVEVNDWVNANPVPLN